MAIVGQAAIKPITTNPVFNQFFIRLLTEFSKRQKLQLAFIPFSDIDSGSEFPYS
jgi:hypothetical protein